MRCQLILVALCFSLMVGSYRTTWAAEPLAEDEATAVKTIAAAQKLIEERDRLGRSLIEIVQDYSQPEERRIEAAHALGKLQYLPAIDVLMTHITLKSQRDFHFEPNTAVDYPMTTALAAYGTAAMPDLVEAVLVEKDPIREHLFFYPIKISKTSEVALRYLRGRETPENPDVIYRNNFQALEEILLEVINDERARK